MSTQYRSLPRLVSKLQNALGDHLCIALDDPGVVEIMLNPDGKLFIERLGHRLTGPKLHIWASSGTVHERLCV